MTHVRDLHLKKTALFVALSLADLYLTRRLIERGGGEIYESNPIAGAWLASYGWSGLALFKGLAILLVVGVTTYISLYRPRTAASVLWFACGTLALVVLFSYSLGNSYASADPPAEHWRFAVLEQEILQPARASLQREGPRPPSGRVAGTLTPGQDLSIPARLDQTSP